MEVEVTPPMNGTAGQEGETVRAELTHIPAVDNEVAAALKI